MGGEGGGGYINNGLILPWQNVKKKTDWTIPPPQFRLEWEPPLPFHPLRTSLLRKEAIAPHGSLPSQRGLTHRRVVHTTNLVTVLGYVYCIQYVSEVKLYQGSTKVRSPPISSSKLPSFIFFVKTSLAGSILSSNLSL